MSARTLTAEIAIHSSGPFMSVQRSRVQRRRASAVRCNARSDGLDRGCYGLVSDRGVSLGTTRTWKILRSLRSKGARFRASEAHRMSNPPDICQDSITPRLNLATRWWHRRVGSIPNTLSTASFRRVVPIGTAALARRVRSRASPSVYRFAQLSAESLVVAVLARGADACGDLTRGRDRRGAPRCRRDVRGASSTIGITVPASGSSSMHQDART